MHHEFVAALLSICSSLLFLVTVILLIGSIRRLGYRVDAAVALERDTRRNVALLSKAAAYDREELQAAKRNIDTLADHVARLEGTPEDRVIAKLSQPPRI
jgi:hypothetical protein